MAEHTPGPWYAGGPMDFDNYIVQTKKGAIAHVHPPHAEAHARLIAAAPELLDAAKRWLYERDLYNVPPRQQERDAERDLRAAIAKAEGRHVR